ncbi:type II toxin-antitoxin system RelE/ParE family toxin [Maribacter sp. 2-571]|uniref:type II toxin-antitoxin system RelE/ParE family toxin n=1 Tax=Maribacter sp. 2-571 TaxID=3417569 RepID=UPI003D328AD2
MGYKVKLLPIVHDDLKKAKKWYSEQRKGLGEELKKEVNAQIDYIGRYPEHFQRRYKELRLSLTDRFPYAIFYIVDEEKKQVIVFGVLHTKRNPEIARKRTGNK